MKIVQIIAVGEDDIFGLGDDGCLYSREYAPRPIGKFYWDRDLTSAQVGRPEEKKSLAAQGKTEGES